MVPAMTEGDPRPDEISIDSASLSDVADLLALWEAAAENESRPADTADAVRTLLIRDPDACLVARQGGRIVGSLIAGWDGWRAHLYRLAVPARHATSRN